MNTAAPAATQAPTDSQGLSHSLSHSVSALILLRAEGRHGEWLPVGELAAHLGCSVPCVRRHCQALVSAGLLQAQLGPCGEGEIESVQAHHPAD